MRTGTRTGRQTPDRPRRPATAVRLAPALALLALAACAGVQDMVAREAARTAIRPVLAERFPGVPLDAASDCILDNASAGDLSRLARGATRPIPDTETTALVVEIATRPAAIGCLTTSGITPFLLR